MRHPLNFTFAFAILMVFLSCGKAKPPQFPNRSSNANTLSKSKLIELGKGGPLACPKPSKFIGPHGGKSQPPTQPPSLWNLALQARLVALIYEAPEEIGTTLESWFFGQKGDGEWFSQCASDLKEIGQSKYTPLPSHPNLSDCGKNFFNQFPKATKKEFAESVFANKYSSSGIQFYSTKHQLERSDLRAPGDTEFLWLVHHQLRVAVLVFQGTTSVGDAFTDVSIAQKNLEWAAPNENSGKVHRGFLKAYQDVRDGIWSKVDTMPKSYSLWVIGHSLGGSLALLTAIDLAVNHGTNVSQMTSFGAPRVGNKDFSKWVQTIQIKKNIPFVRIRNDVRSEDFDGRDLIPWLPIGTLLTGTFQKAGTTVSLFPDGTTDLTSSAIKKKNGIRARLRSISGHAWNTIVGSKHHDTDEYLRRMNRSLKHPQNQEWLSCGE